MKILLRKNKMILYVDMDEVFSDFIGGACHLHKVDKQKVHNHCREIKTWSISSAIEGQLKIKRTLKYTDVFTETDLWSPILANEFEFWSRLEPTPWANTLLSFLELCPYEWYLVSSPFNSEQCHQGKIRWIHRFFGPKFDRFLLTPYKHLLSQPGTLLIDDSPTNCEKFRANGGLSYLFGSSPLASVEANKDPVKDLVAGIFNLVSH